MKTIYEFKVAKQIEVEKDGIKTKELTPVFFAIRKPSRYEKEEAELVRAEYLSKYIRHGVIPEAVLRKNYVDQGGTMDQFEKDNLLLLNLKLFEKTEEYKRLAVDKQADKANKEQVLKEIIDLKEQITSIQYKQGSYFENTAESKATTKLIEYLFTHLTVFKEKEDDAWQTYFEGDSFEKKLDTVDKLEEEGDELYLKAKDKLIFAVSLYVHAGGNIKAEEVKKTVEDNLAE